MSDDFEAKTFTAKKIAILILCLLCGAVVLTASALLVLHFTPLRGWMDPVEDMRIGYLLRTTSDETKKANIHLNEAQQQSELFLSTFKENNTDWRLSTIANRITHHDEMAAHHMDQAKKSGQNIDEQVQKLCDMLEAQMVFFSAAKQVQSGKSAEELWRTIETVEHGIHKAMEW